MTNEEKKAIEELKEFIEDENIENISVFIAKKILNLIETQQKEIEELKEKNKKAIEFINNENNYFEDGENWQNILKIKEILEE